MSGLDVAHKSSVFLELVELERGYSVFLLLLKALMQLVPFHVGIQSHNVYEKGLLQNVYLGVQFSVHGIHSTHAFKFLSSLDSNLTLGLVDLNFRREVCISIVRCKFNIPIFLGFDGTGYFL